LTIFIVHSTMLYNAYDPAVPVSLWGDQSVAQGINDFMVPFGFVCLSFFFILSGFVLNWTVDMKEKARTIWRRRIAKLFPNHIVTWAVCMVLFAAATVPTYSWLPNLFLLHSWSPDPDVQSGVNFPVWSLCSELLFYLLFPFLIKPIRRIAQHRLWWWAGSMAIGIVVFNLITLYLINDANPTPVIPLSLDQIWFSYKFPVGRMFEFVLGMIMARIVQAGMFPRIKAGWVALLYLAGLVAASFIPAPWQFSLVTLVPNAVVIAAVAQSDVRGNRNFLSSKPMIFLGNISFAFFVVQAPLVVWGRTQLTGTFSTPVATLLWFAELGATILVAWVLYSVVEMPVMKHWSRKKRPVTTLPEARTERSAAESELVA
jgi:peptidoglycan/LPS O-acetylase OafA/YrhL